MSIRLSLDVRLEGVDDPVGHLSVDDTDNVSFGYSPAYLDAAGAVPLSVSLPLQPDIFDDTDSRIFFQNLLQENNQLEDVVRRHSLERTDLVGILYHLGSDCPGALSCVPEGSPAQKVPGILSEDYEILPAAKVADLVRRLAAREPFIQEYGDPSPLAGVQSKIAVAVVNEQIALPLPGRKVPTTHILKVPRRGSEVEVALEAAAMELMAKAGLDVAKVSAFDADGAPALLVERFDRRIEDGRVTRIHQEDFAQALGLTPSMKYERSGVDGRRFDVPAIYGLLRRTRVPAAGMLTFIRATIANFAVGNTDNHAKNHALLYSVPGRPALAPLYDVMPILLDKSVRHDLAYRIGDATLPADVNATAVSGFLTVMGIRSSVHQRYLHEQVSPMLQKIENACRKNAYPKALQDLVGQQLQQLNTSLDLQLDLEERDYRPTSDYKTGWGFS